MQRLFSFTHKSLSKSSYYYPPSSSSHICSSSRNLSTHGKKRTNQLLTSPCIQSNSTSSTSFNSVHAWGHQHYKNITELMKRIDVLCNSINLKKLITTTRLVVPSRRSFSEWRYHRGWPRRSLVPNADQIVWGLIGMNFGILLMWRSGDWLFMLRNFTVSMENLVSGRVHTLLTAAFSHQDLGHLLQNCFGLYFFGTQMAKLFGPLFLLKLYVAGGVVGSMFFLVHDAFHRSSSKDAFRPKAYALGASGAVNAIILLNVFLFPKAIHYLNFFIPVPAALSGAILIGTDIWRTMQPNSGISGAAHLGGAVVAALVWARIRRRWI
ncbi:hypothetical protein H6P81_003316 [Aristolochia fimbriata]|uniref:Peptidase S54 rhomboid domain-containing protein n=1 Tax=Aristolochia fimbriata TaxID=158543 RepID=A0AAV7FGL8_ARIFI|nr:hypothetical protein H6P81_003316 [Aristolochia fimbriata]